MPVTQAEYQRFIQANPTYPVPYRDESWARPYNWDQSRRTLPAGKDQHPVVLVSWEDAAAYCEWAGKRLPIDEEWEKAARGASNTRAYPWGDGDPNCMLANSWNGITWDTGYQCVGDTSRAGSYPLGASPYGALDMSGNVWEWVSDWYEYYYYSTSPDTNPLGPETGLLRVTRGGSWIDGWTGLRVAYRNQFEPSYSFCLIGFRCAWGVPAE